MGAHGMIDAQHHWPSGKEIKTTVSYHFLLTQHACNKINT
jgi:hypothetical protein